MSFFSKRLGGLLGALAGAGILAASHIAMAETTYNVAATGDFSGPYADVMPQIQSGREAVIAWWNDEVGSGLGVKLNMKVYDNRYDAAQMSSLWPGIKSELDPLFVLGLGGPDVAALQERLPSDGIPMYMATAGYGFAWKPGSWIFNPRATYAHEAGAFLEWLLQQRGGDEPLKYAVVSSEASPAYVDIAKGLEAFDKSSDKVELVEVIWTEVQPTDLTTQIRRVVRAGAEAILVQTNTQAVVATQRALQALGKDDIPIMMSSHNGLPLSGKAAGGLEQMEGNFEAYGMVIPTEDDSEAYRFYKTLQEDYGLKSGWNIVTVMGIEQALYSTRILETAIAKHGADKVTGKAMREATFAAPIPSKKTFGFLSTLNFSDEAPFPTKGMTINIGTVKDGKYTTAAADVPVPDIAKW